MSLLPLANVVAAGFDWDYLWHWTHDDGLIKAAIAAVIAGFVSLSVAWWNGLKVDKQIELSKEATPPELTRYKEWLEVSEKYKELVNSTNVHILGKSLEEYQEIESSRKAALGRATWERKVLSVCPQVDAQKRLLNISPSFIVNDDSNSQVIRMPDFKSSKLFLAEIIILAPVALCLVGFPVFWLLQAIFKPAPGDSLVDNLILVLLSICVVNILLNVADSMHSAFSGSRFAEYAYLCIVREKVEDKEFLGLVESVAGPGNNSSRFYYAVMDADYRELVYCPKILNSKYSPISSSFMLMLPYWMINIICKKNGYNIGEYKSGVFKIENELIDEKTDVADDKGAIQGKYEECSNKGKGGVDTVDIHIHLSK